MRINNVEKWRKDVENAMKETFAFVETAERIRNEQKCIVIHGPIMIKDKENKPFLIIDVEPTDGSIIIWDNKDLEIQYILDVKFYKNRISMLCRAVYCITSLMSR